MTNTILANNSHNVADGQSYSKNNNKYFHLPLAIANRKDLSPCAKALWTFINRFGIVIAIDNPINNKQRKAAYVLRNRFMNATGYSKSAVSRAYQSLLYHNLIGNNADRHDKFGGRNSYFAILTEAHISAVRQDRLALTHSIMASLHAIRKAHFDRRGADWNGCIDISYSKIALSIGKSRRQAINIVNAMVDKGVLHKVVNGKGKSNRYIVVADYIQSLQRKSRAHKVLGSSKHTQKPRESIHKAGDITRAVIAKPTQRSVSTPDVNHKVKPIRKQSTQPTQPTQPTQRQLALCRKARAPLCVAYLFD